MDGANDDQFFFTAERNGKMPHVQSGLYLSSIRFRTCKEAQLAIYVYKTNFNYDESTGVPVDAWYAIETPGLPVRFIRIFSGPEGLHDLLLRYAFHDAGGCEPVCWYSCEPQPISKIDRLAQASDLVTAVVVPSQDAGENADFGG